MTIYQLQNKLYTDYLITSRYNSKKKSLHLEDINKFEPSSTLRKAIGEEISDFLKTNKNVIVY